MFKRLFSYLEIGKVGLLELLFAFYPILSGYAYGPLRMDVLVLVIMSFLAYIRKKEIYYYIPFFALAVYVILHECLLFGLLPLQPTYHINTIISTSIVFASIVLIVPALDWRKLKSALTIVAIISMLGILYHFILIQAGQKIHPIKIPFLPALAQGTRLHELGSRPVSFYWEPAAFVTYMMVPLFLSLTDKKLYWTLAIIFSMFLSTSSTGIILSVGMIGAYMLTQKMSIKSRVFIVIIGVGIVYFLLNSSMFEAGVKKIDNTKIEETSRLINGPRLVAAMPTEHLFFGIPCSNVDDYYKEGNVHARLLYTRQGTIFVSTFWLMLAKFGIIGLLTYLNLYFQNFRNNRRLMPYVLVLIVAMFSQGIMFTSTFAFQMIFMFSFIKYEREQSCTVSELSPNE